jgi:hypothetical protein
MTALLKSTMRSIIPATFNMGLLFNNIKTHQRDADKITKFLKTNSIRDYRICPDELINKGHGFSEISSDLIHYLFDSINFHELFNTTDDKKLIEQKINVYNNVVSHYKLCLVDEFRHANITSEKEYQTKICVYLKEVVRRSIVLHKETDEYGTRQEGTENFWFVVDHYIFVNKMKQELNSLKTLRANSE